MSVLLRNAVTDFRRRALLLTLVAGQSDDVLADAAGDFAVWEVFEDESDLLVELQGHWLDLLTKAVYAAPAYPLGDELVKKVYAALAAEHQALRATLDARQDEFAIRGLVQEERILLARAAGHLDQVSTATLSWRGRDLVEGLIPSQREG